MDPAVGARGGGGSWKGDRTWEDPALPTIKTDWVQQVGGTPSGLVQSAPVLHQKNRMMPEIAQSRMMDIEGRLARTWGPGGGENESRQYLRLRMQPML